MGVAGAARGSRTASAARGRPDSGEKVASAGGMSAIAHAPVPDRVRANTWPGVNDRLETQAQLRLGRAAASDSSDDLRRRIAQLDYEWDFDRVLETEASLMGLIGLTLSATLDKRLLVLLLRKEQLSIGIFREQK